MHKEQTSTKMLNINKLSVKNKIDWKVLVKNALDFRHINLRHIYFEKSEIFYKILQY